MSEDEAANATKAKDKGERGTPGPKKDERHGLSFKVEQDVYDLLLTLQPETSLPPDDVAALLLHKMIRDPEGVKALLDALRPRRPVTATTELDRRRQDRRGAS